MSNFQDPGVQAEAAVASAATAEAIQTVVRSKWYRWRKDGTALVRYLLDSEVHTYAFSVAANAILSFIPFIVLLYKISHSLFQSTVMVRVVTQMVQYFLPANQDFVAKSLDGVATQQGVTLISLVMILIACTGIFLPLEVALNQAWGVVKSRNYLLNQCVAFGLAILMVILGMLAILINAGAHEGLALLFFGHVDNFVFKAITWVLLAATTGVASILFFFSIYWLLPNRKVPARHVFKTSIYTGIIWLVSKYIFQLILPHMDLEALYGRFYVSVGLLFWAYISGLILFAGAQFSVARMGQHEGQALLEK